MKITNKEFYGWQTRALVTIKLNDNSTYVDPFYIWSDEVSEDKILKALEESCWDNIDESLFGSVNLSFVRGSMDTFKSTDIQKKVVSDIVNSSCKSIDEDKLRDVLLQMYLDEMIKFEEDGYQVPIDYIIQKSKA